MNSDHDHTTMLEAPCAKPWTLATKLILAALLACTVGGMAPACAKTPGEVAIGEVLRDAPMLGLNGPARRLSEFRGRPLIITVWASWCGPCREEMPTLQTFYEKYKSNGFVLIGVNQEETRKVVEPFVKEFGLTFPIWLDPAYLATEQAFKTLNLPSSYVIDRAGVVRLMWVGEISRAMLEKHVTPIIREKP